MKLPYRIYARVSESSGNEYFLNFDTRPQAQEMLKILLAKEPKVQKVRLFYQRFGMDFDMDEFERLEDGSIMHLSMNVYINPSGDLINCEPYTHKYLAPEDQGPVYYAPIEETEATKQADAFVELLMNWQGQPNKTKNSYVINHYLPAILFPDVEPLSPTLWGLSLESPY